MLTTYADLMEHALSYLGTDATRESNARVRSAVQTAYKILPARHQWSFLWALGRVTTNGSYNTGTIDFDLTGGANERQVTLAGGTWPTWAAEGYLLVNNVPYEIDARVSNTVVTLSAATAPAADVAAGTSYTLMRDAYRLPADFLAGDEVTVNNVGTVMSYTHPRDWSSQRRVQSGPGQPWSYSYVGDPDRPDTTRMVLWPPPDSDYAIDILYRRKMRPLVYDQVTAGFASVGAGGVTISGSDTSFKAAHVGSMVRLGADSADLPTGPGGANPAAFEGRVTAVASTTSLTVDVPAVDALDSVRYVISDPADIDGTIMLDYLLREIEYQCRIQFRMEPTKFELQDYSLALTRAMEADNRNTAREAALRKQTRRSGFVHYPISFTGG